MPSQSPQYNAEVAGVLHDVRQMLMVITGRAGLLQMRIEDEDTREDLKTIALAAGQAGEILARLSGSSGRRRRAVPGDLRKALDQTAHLACPEGHHTWIITDTVPENPVKGTWHMVLGVPEGLRTVVPQPVLREVLNNLALNALNVMPGGGQLVAACRREGAQFQLTLRDTGPGIPADRRDQIFVRGFTTSGDEGRGIGLAFSRDLLGRFGAKLDLCPEDDQPGACFRLTLPVLPDGDVPEAEPTAEKGGSLSPFRPSVLVVDDEVAVREMMGDVLTELGCTASLARDGQEAMTLFEKDAFGMVILDQSLPGLSGLDLADVLRRKAADLVLVLMSGWGQKEILDKAQGAYVDLVAEKPLTVDKIAELLDEAGRLARRKPSGS